MTRIVGVRRPRVGISSPKRKPARPGIVELERRIMLDGALPDLLVSAASAPASAVVGNGTTIPISFTVTNDGTADVPAQTYWQDAVYLSPTATYNPNTAVSVASQYNPYTKPLPVGSSYTTSANATVPNFPVGQAYLIFEADAFNGLVESDETNNAKAVPIALNSPGNVDLKVTSVSSSASTAIAGDGQTVDVTYTVKNVGTVAAAASWYDEIDLANAADGTGSPVLLTTSSPPDGTPPLAAGASYTLTQTVTIPNTDAGSKFLSVTTDRYNSQFETDATNDQASIPITITRPNVDLAVTSPSAPTSAIDGASIPVSFSVKNNGTDPAAGSWNDQVYLSSDSTLSNDDSLLTSLSANTAGVPLAPGQSYLQNTSVSIYNAKVGDFFLLFVTNPAQGTNRPSQAETDEPGLANDVQALPIHLDAPDLAVSGLQAPSSAILGATIPVSFTVTNVGDVATATTWQDAIYLSDTPTFNSSTATYVASFSSDNSGSGGGGVESTGSPLAPGDSYTRNETVTLPDSPTGNRYLLVVTDGAGQYSYFGQPELNAANDVQALPISLAAPDLTLTGATAPASAVLGDTVPVSFTVSNAGSVEAPAYWTDAVYLSPTSTYDPSTAIFVNSFSQNDNSPLAPGASYTRNENVRLPGGISGDAYILFIADAYHAQGDVNRANNVESLPIHLDAPDLTATALSAPASASLGQSISVTYSVKNVGTVPAPGSWNDAFYISDTATLDTSKATFVGYSSVSGQSPLAAGASYSWTQSIAIPNTATGDRYLIVVTDFNDGQPETDTTNDTFAAPIHLDAPDLSVTTASSQSTSLVVDGTDSVSWTVKDLAATPAAGQWYDQLYLSTKSTFDSSAVSIGQFSASDVSPLAGGASYSRTETVTIPSTAPQGSVYLLVVTNPYNGQPESDGGGSKGTNNTFAIPVTVSAPDLTVTDASVTPAEFEEGNGQSVTVNYTVKNQGTVAALHSWYDDIYVSSSPTYDSTAKYLGYAYFNNTSSLAAGSSYSESVPVTIPATAAGAQYILIVANQSFSQGESDQTNNMKAVPVTVDAPAVDLTITAATGPSEAVVNQALSLSLTVKNAGTAPANGSWTDGVYLSKTSTLDNTALYLAAGYPASPLAAGASYTETLTGTLYNETSGDYYLIFRTDDNGHQGETDATNDLKALPIHIDVPDLVVSNLQAPAALELNKTYTISYTVTNPSAFDTQVPWADQIYLGDHPTLTGNYSSVAYIDQGPYGGSNNSPLKAGQSYTETYSLTVPNGQTGNLYLIVMADSYQEQGVVDPTHLVASVPVHVAPSEADLTVTDASAPASAVLGVPFSASFTVENAGDNDASAKWYDAVYVSNNTKLDSTATLVAQIDESGQSPLSAGSSYTASPTLTIPQTAIGDRYLLFVTNSNGAQEELDSTNNTKAVPISLNAPDPAVTAVTAPSFALPGDTIHVTWTVTNKGDVPTTANWTDTVALSTDGSLGGIVAYLTGVNVASPTLPLAPGQSYTLARDLTLPTGIAPRSYQVLIETDSGGYYTAQPESDTTNDVGTAPIAIGASDLTVDTFVAPTSANYGDTLTLTWTDRNDGVPPINTAWSDGIYLSSNSSFDTTATLLQTVSASDAVPLAAGDSSARSAMVTIPITATSASGNYYLFVVVDSLNQIAETNEANNTASAPIALTVPALPDLIVTNLSTPATGYAGVAATITWTDANVGQAEADGTWVDRVFASLSGSGSNPIALGNFPLSGPLAAGSAVNRSIPVTLPSTPGTYYLFVNTDATNVVAEAAGEANNVTGSPVPAVLTIAPLPDLVVTSVVPPADGVTGGIPIPIRFTVKNQGAAPTQSPAWDDFVILSQDSTLTFDGSYDQLLNNQPVLAEFPNPSYLNPGQSYTQTVNVTLPKSASGPWYAYVVANGLGSHYAPGLAESDRTNNLLKSASFNVLLSPPADLQTSNVAAPAQAFSGQPLSVGWTVTNVGAGTTDVSGWTDEVYLSPTSTFDASSAIDLGGFDHSGALRRGPRIGARPRSPRRSP